jgi:7-alpha-hydroxysteroid dehydrogenase
MTNVRAESKTEVNHEEGALTMGVLEQFGLEGQVAVVTGAGKGIGRGIALCLAEAGADVAVAARNEAEIKEVASEIRALGRRAIAVPTDVTEEGALEALSKSTIDGLGSLTIWVNNAGGIPDTTARYLTKVDDAAWDSQLDLNLKAVWVGSKVAAAAMPEAGGSIINISSRTAFGPQSKNGPYGAAKAAVNSLTETLAVELAPRIRVNAVAPGPIPTQNFIECTKVDPTQLEAMEKALPIPLRRFGTPEDIGAAVVFMASPAASWVTGQCLYVTGGM